jgi:hypothetical protein
MKAIIHDWDDEASLKILNNCRQSIRDDGKLYGARAEASQRA